MVKYTEEEEEEASIPTSKEAFKEYKLLRKKREEEGSGLGATLAGATPLLLGLLTGEVATGMQAAGQTVGQFAAQKEKNKDAYEQALLKLATTSDSSRVTPIPYPLSGPGGKPHVGLLNPKSGEVTLVGVPQFTKPEPEKETYIKGEKDYYLVKGGKKMPLGIAPPKTSSATDIPPAEKSAKVQLGKDYAEFTSKEKAKMENNLKLLKSTIDELKADPELTGFFKGMLAQAPGKQKTAPRITSIQARVQKVVNESLRQLLGAQFTEEEGKRVVKNAFDPQESVEENIRRISAIYDQLLSTYKGQVEAFKKEGLRVSDTYSAKEVIPDKIKRMIQFVKENKGKPVANQVAERLKGLGYEIK